MIICSMIKTTIIGCITPKLQMGIKICILLHQFSLLALHLLVNGVLVMEVWILEEVMEILEEVEILVETMEVGEIVEELEIVEVEIMEMEEVMEETVGVVNNQHFL